MMFCFDWSSVYIKTSLPNKIAYVNKENINLSKIDGIAENIWDELFRLHRVCASYHDKPVLF